jgi:hypothetical protein
MRISPTDIRLSGTDKRSGAFPKVLEAAAHFFRPDESIAVPSLVEDEDFADRYPAFRNG